MNQPSILPPASMVNVVRHLRSSLNSPNHYWSPGQREAAAQACEETEQHLGVSPASPGSAPSDQNEHAVAKHPIPEVKDPAAIYWLQPKREDIKIEGVFAVMGMAAFTMLSTPERPQIPPCVGMMWKRAGAELGVDSHYLCWYDYHPFIRGRIVAFQLLITLK